MLHIFILRKVKDEDANCEYTHRFLIHYTSRDTVDVLSQGAKGVTELREAAEKYYNGTYTATTKGPLFGMIDFRRRKVLIKLVPDDTSRLVKGIRPQLGGAWEHIG
jgi:hypothetical protein